MHINREINKIEKKVSKQIDEMTMRNVEELNHKIYEYFTPYSEQIQELIIEVYGHPYMTVEQFENYTQKINELLEPFKQDNRDELLVQFSEEVVRKNKTMLVESINEMLNEFQTLGISYHRAILEHKKVFNSAVSRMQRYLNLNYYEVCGDLKEICRFCIDSMLDYNKTRVIIDEEEIEEIEIEFEVTNNRLFRTDNVYDIIELAISNGFREERQCGSHKIFKHSNGQIVVIPVHGKAINVSLAFGIQKQIYDKIA